MVAIRTRYIGPSVVARRPQPVLEVETTSAQALDRSRLCNQLLRTSARGA